MADDLDDKYARFVTKLIELTQSGQLAWRARGHDLYASELNKRMLQVERTEDESYSKQAVTIGAALGIGATTSRRRYNYTLTVSKTEDADHFYLKNSYGVQNLYTSAVLGATKIEKFIDEILA